MRSSISWLWDTWFKINFKNPYCAMALVLALSPKIQTNYELLSDSEDRQLSCSIEERELAISSMIADGVPKIFFTCYRAPKKSEPKLYVSTNQANWEGMPVDFSAPNSTWTLSKLKKPRGLSMRHWIRFLSVQTNLYEENMLRVKRGPNHAVGLKVLSRVICACRLFSLSEL